MNTLTAGQKYSLLNRDYLTQPTQMQLSLKGKTFSSFFFFFFFEFLTCRLSFEHFRNKDHSHR